MIFGTLLGIAFSEAAYRAYLYEGLAHDRFVRRLPQDFAVNDRPMWIYDERFGYVYPKGGKIHVATISNGRVVSCGYWENFNGEGNVGKIVGDYKTASLKILVFGDSFTATAHEGVGWPLLLQERLAQRLGRSVEAVNFGRDGYGVLQMFDLAAAKIPEWKPDLAIIAFITNDLQRVRVWRTITKVKGRWRYLVSPDPTPNPDPLKSYDTALYHPEATAEWCRSMKGTGSRDRVVEEIAQVYQQGISVGERRAANVYTTGHSYLLARLMHGDPFHGVPGMFSFPVIQYASYAEDSRFVESLRTILATGVPLVLVHLAFFPEFKEGKEYIMTYSEASLLKSLSEVTGKPILETTKYARLPVQQPERLIQAPDNYHPSLEGLRFYADAVAEMLVRDGVVK